MRRGEVSTVLDTGETTGRARMGVMRRAGVGGGEGSEVTEGGEERGAGDKGKGMIAAERSASRGEDETVGVTRVRPASPMV